jgi:hypothetical protein
MTGPSISETETPVDQQEDALFDTIESAHQYVQLLAEVVSDSRNDLEREVSREQATQFPRRLDAVRLALYNLDKLQLHMKAGSRILNDLRSLRRLLFEERK